MSPEEVAFACFELPRDHMRRVEADRCGWALIPLDAEERVARAVRAAFEAGRRSVAESPHEGLSTK